MSEKSDRMSMAEKSDLLLNGLYDAIMSQDTEMYISTLEKMVDLYARTAKIPSPPRSRLRRDKMLNAEGDLWRIAGHVTAPISADAARREILEVLHDSGYVRLEYKLASRPPDPA